MCNGSCCVIYKREAVGGGRWQARCQRRHQEVSTQACSLNVFFRLAKCLYIRPISCHVTSLPWQEPEEELNKLLLTMVSDIDRNVKVKICQVEVWSNVHINAGLLLITSCSWQQTSTTCFAGDSGYWTIVFEVWHARCSGWHLSPHSWILLRRRSASFITADSDPIRSTWIGHDPIPIR